MDFYRLLPRFWIQNKPVSKVWDEALNFALDNYEVTSVSSCRAMVGPFTVWIANYPYSFGYNCDDPLELLPRVKTRIRLRRAVEQFQRDCYMRLMQKDRT